MNEQPYKVEHLQDYQGILTSRDSRGRFKMELKVEDNPILKRSVEKIESRIELEFYYNMGPSTLFFHNINTCPCAFEGKQCDKCKDIIDKYHQFAANIEKLQIGDTFKIKAALINNDRSELPRRIQSFKDYEPLTAASTEYQLRLPDTPEGINKKYELKEQRLQREREAEEKRKEDEEQAQKDARCRKRKESVQHFLGKRPNLNQIIVTVIATTIANQILPRLFRWVISFF